MGKTILLTGATDGIGLETAKALAPEGHRLLIHGRNPDKLAAAQDQIGVPVETFQADFSKLSDVARMAEDVLARHDQIDVLINNAGILKTPAPLTAEGMDVRFVVNILAPVMLTQKLLSVIPQDGGRVVNLSSAAQAPVSLAALAGRKRLEDFEAYAQSKLALTMWTAHMAATHPDGPLFVAVNPGSLLASKMVKEGFGMPGNDIAIGVDILKRAALAAEFDGRSVF